MVAARPLRAVRRTFFLPMKQFFLTVLGVFAGLVLFLVVVPFVLIMSLAASGSAAPTTAPNTVLEIDLREGLTDQPPTNPLAVFGGGGLAVIDVVDALERAAADRNVKGVLIRLPETGMTPAAADELRQAIVRFRGSDKPVVAHSQGFMPIGTVVDSYMVGAAADELWMQNTATFGATGLALDQMFLGRAAERYGVDVELEQRYEYKNAVNEYLESDFTPAHREAMSAWMQSIFDTALGTAARDREIDPAAMRTAIESGPHTSQEALNLRLIDRIGQVEEAERYIKEKAGRNAELVPIGDYIATHGPRPGSGGDVIAIVGGEGAIVTGAGGSADPFGGGSMIYSDATAEAIYDAIDDEDVKAIVFRVSSPGGSPEASEQILAAVRAAKAAGKPVVVSMGAYAASGGYWISSEASAIIAQPSTLTGSIGVFGGKFVFADALSRFGVDMRGISVGGDYSDAYSTAEPFNQAQRAELSAQMDRIYEDFVTRVATGRNIPPERVREIARGRVWTGAQARELGLVDELGGLHEAIRKAKELANIAADQSVSFRRYPQPLGFWDALSEAFGVSSQGAQALVALGGAMNDPGVQSTMRRVETERMRQRGAVVLADQPVN